MSLEVFVPCGGAGRLAIQQCSRLPNPELGFGFQKGVYHDVEPLVMAATCVRAVAQRLPGFEPGMVNGLILTCANPTGQQNFTGRTVVNYLQWGDCWGNLINQLCMSGITGQQYAANLLASPFMTKPEEPMVIGVVGVEKMSVCRLENIFARDYTPSAHQALTPAAMAMGYTAEQTADRFEITKEECDQLALLENKRVRQAIEQGWFAEEIVPIEVNGQVIDQDAMPAELTPQMLAKGKFYFRSPQKGGKLTNFSSSQMSDGAAALFLCNAAAMEKYGWQPMARFIGGAVGTADPRYMGEGLIAAFEAFLRWAGYTQNGNFLVDKFLADYGLLELNTAFASVPLALAKKHNIPLDIINVAGGATTPLGHPLGATGVRLAVTLLHLMKRLKVKRGYLGACVGEGQGGAAAYENLVTE